MSDNETEDVLFLPDISAGKKSVYEPYGRSRCVQWICQQSRLLLIVTVTVVIALVITLTAVLTRPATGNCGTPATTPAPVQPTEAIATNGEKFPWTDIRLPSHLIPVHYTIRLHPNLTTFHFRGNISIKLSVHDATDFIVLHSKGLNVTDHSVIRNQQKVKVVRYLEYKQHEMLYLQLDRKLPAGSVCHLKLSFQGVLSMQSLTGFYRSSYHSQNGTITRWLATTQFEPTDARAAFPCFDEPQMKATFSLGMVRDDSHISLFNTRINTTLSYRDHLVVDQFETTVKMSTYLVAFIVCDFDKKSKYTKNTNVKVSVYAPPEQIEQAEFALEAAVSIIEYYEDFFGIAFPLPKQDLVAIPDFAAGAMENWGLITYRLTAILYDPLVSPEFSKEWVGIVVAHELAHQWFGNLVTMEWWNDLWLNEGFASFVENIGADHFQPEWKMMDQFILNFLVRAFEKDSLSNSHPITVPVDDPAEINEIFDSISYDKGSCIIRMLEGFLGRATLQKGLKRYLQKYRFGNAVTDDLWSSLSEQVQAEDGDFDVKEVMDTWTKQMGFPYITIKREGSHITAKQQRFLLNPRANQSSEFTSPYDYKWQVPITYSTDSKQFQSGVIWMKTDQVEFDVSGNPKWLKVNVNHTGFYRVHYDLPGWQALIGQLRTDHNALTASDRAGLIDDAFTLARAGHLQIEVALNLSRYLKDEEEYVPWAVGIKNLKYVGKLLEDKPAYDDFSTYMKSLIHDRIQALGWKDEGSHLQKYLRSMLLGTAVKFNDKPNVQEALKEFREWKEGDKVGSDLKVVVYASGIHHGTEDDWNFMWKKQNETKVPSEKKMFLQALATTRDAFLLNKYLNMVLDMSKIRQGDAVTVLGHIASNAAGRVLAWRYTKQHWATFIKRYGRGSFDMTRLVMETAGGFTTQYDYEEIKAFFADHPAGSGTRGEAQALEHIQMHIDWLKRNEKAASDWLRNEVSSMTSSFPKSQ